MWRFGILPSFLFVGEEILKDTGEKFMMNEFIGLWIGRYGWVLVK